MAIPLLPSSSLDTSLKGMLLINPDFIGGPDDTLNLDKTMQFIRVLNFMFHSYGHSVNVSISWSQETKVIAYGNVQALYDIKHLTNLAFWDFERAKFHVDEANKLVAARNPKHFNA